MDDIKKAIDGHSFWIMMIALLSLANLVLLGYNLGNANNMMTEISKVKENSANANAILTEIFPLFQEGLTQLHSGKSIKVEATNLNCDSIEQQVGIAGKTLFFGQPTSMYSVAMEKVLDSLNISYIPICTCDNDACWNKCTERGYLINNSVSLAQKYNVTVIPTLVFDHCTKKRVGSIASLDVLYNQNNEETDLKQIFSSLAATTTTLKQICEGNETTCKL